MLRTLSLSSLRQSFQRIQRFAGAYGWLFRHHILDRWWIVGAILAMSIGGAAAEAMSVGLIGSAASVMGNAQSDPSSLGSLLKDFGTWRLWGFCGCLFLLQVAAACSAYYSMLLTRRIARRQHEHFLTDILRQAAQWPGTPTENGNKLTFSSNEIRQLAMRDPNHMGRAIESVVHLVQPMCRWAASVVMLLVLQPVLTLMVAPFLVLITPVIYRLSASVQSDARRFYNGSATEFGRHVAEVMRQIEGRNVAYENGGETVATALYANPHVSGYFDGLDCIKLMKSRMLLATSLFSSLLLALVLLATGYLASIQTLSWSMVIAYLMSIRYFVNNMKGSIGGFTNLNHFYPSIQRYLTFRKQIEAGDPVRTEMPAAIRIEPSGEMADSLSELELHPGKPTWVVSPYPVSRFELPSILLSLCAASDVPDVFCSSEVCFDSYTARLPAVSVEHFATGGDPSPDRLARARQVMEDLGVEEPPEIAGKVLELPMVARLDRQYLFTLRMLSLTYDESPLVFLDAELMSGLSDDWIAKALELFAGRYVFIVGRPTRQPRGFVESVVAVHDGAVVGVGNGEWYRSVSDDFTERLTLDTTLSTDDDLLFAA